MFNRTINITYNDIAPLLEKLNSIDMKFSDLFAKVVEIREALTLEISQINAAIALLSETLVDGGTAEQRQELYDMLVGVKDDIVNIIPDEPVEEEEEEDEDIVE
jgi:hypothetical protein